VPRGVVAAMAVATGAIIANLYYAQPLVDVLASEFAVGPGPVGTVIAVTQGAYALGLALLVPLGDLVERRRLLAVLLGLATAGLVVAALAPSIVVLAAAAALVGLTSVAVQVLVPFAAVVSAPGQQARAVATVMTGLLSGILLARTVAGVVAGAAGWRAVYVLAAVLTAAVGVVLWRVLPRVAPTARMGYGALLGSVVELVRTEPVLRVRMVYGAATFGAFSAFWASAGFLLAREPYGWDEAAIGAFALFGALGAIAAQFAGRLADRGLAAPATGAFLLLTAVSFALLGFGEYSLVALAAGAVLMDLGVQGTHITNQSQIFPLRPEARSRLNTAYMTAYFVAGTLGSAASVAAYAVAGWGGACAVGGGLAAVGLVVWVVGGLARRAPTQVSGA
jgi:predicted MFS family arabinose efflux permease